MYSTLSIANYFITLGLEENKPITPMKLQKLVYFAHGFYLANFNKPLINESIQAWRYGPVIYTIYRVFKIYGNSPITNTVQFTPDIKEQELPSEVKDFLQEVWDLLKEYDAIQLSNLTHVRKSPWDVVVENNGAIISNSLPISDSIIQDYFTREYVK